MGWTRQIPGDKVETIANVLQATNSERLNVLGAAGFSIEVEADVDTPSAQTFDSEAASVLTDQSLTYTAVTPGTAGDAITIELIDPGANDQTLAVAVVASTRIQVSLATDSGGTITSTGDDVKAAVNADSPGAADLVLVSGTNASPVTALAETPLAGGVDSEVEENGDNTVDLNAAAYVTGLKGQLTTTGTLPAGLSLATDYFIIKDSDTLVRFATTLANALAGTVVTITDEGVGVHTFTPTTLAGASVTFQKTNCSGEDLDRGLGTWTNIASAANITADGSTWLEVVNPTYRFVRAVFAITAGIMDLQLRKIVIKQ